MEQLQASLTAQAAKQASLEEQLAEAQERLAMEDGNKVFNHSHTFFACCVVFFCMHTHCCLCALTASSGRNLEC